MMRVLQILSFLIVSKGTQIWKGSHSATDGSHLPLILTGAEPNKWRSRPVAYGLRFSLGRRWWPFI